MDDKSPIDARLTAALNSIRETELILEAAREKALREVINNWSQIFMLAVLTYGLRIYGFEFSTLPLPLLIFLAGIYFFMILITTLQTIIYYQMTRPSKDS